MSTNVLTLKGNKSKTSVELPQVFNTPYRPDVIRRAVLSEQTKQRQPQGRYPLAGRLVAATSLGPGRGVSKVPRTHGKSTQHGNRGTLVNSTVGGRLAFPPSTEENTIEKINKKEYKLALYSAISATANKDLIINRGHLFNEKLSFPLIVDDKLTALQRTSELIEIFDNLGVGDDLRRSQIRIIRAGKGTMRGRKYRRKVGPLLVVADDCDVMKATKNIPGVEVCKVKDLTVEKLAPGTHAGRLTVWTAEAIKALEELK